MHGLFLVGTVIEFCLGEVERGICRARSGLAGSARGRTFVLAARHTRLAILAVRRLGTDAHRTPPRCGLAKSAVVRALRAGDIMI